MEVAMKRLVILLALVLVLATVTVFVSRLGEARSIEQANLELDKLGLNYRSVEQFLGTIDDNEFKIFLLFLEAGMSPNVTDAKFRESALYVAAGWCRISMIRELLKPQHGAKVNLVDYAGRTALMSASQNGCGIEIAEALVRAGADVDAVDDTSRLSALGYAFGGNGNMPYVQYLSKIAGLETLTEALKMAQQSGSSEGIKILESAIESRQTQDASSPASASVASR
jgi:hypothetical protein